MERGERRGGERGRGNRGSGKGRGDFKWDTVKGREEKVEGKEVSWKRRVGERGKEKGVGMGRERRGDSGRIKRKVREGEEKKEGESGAGKGRRGKGNRKMEDG